MTLSSLLFHNDGPQLTITSKCSSSSSSTAGSMTFSSSSSASSASSSSSSSLAGDEPFGWSNFPLVYQHYGGSTPPTTPTIEMPLRSKCATTATTTTTTTSTRSPLPGFVLSPFGFSDDSSCSTMTQRDSTDSIASAPTSYAVSSSSSPSLSAKKSVTFAESLEVCEYSIMVGQHPCCRDNLALTLGWERAEPTVENLDQYDHLRQAYRRHGDHLRLSYWERKNILRRVGGYTEADLREQQKNLQRGHPTSSMHLCDAE